jgi:[acyl-carrier-protein] S-malonyltransferase
VSGDAFGAVEAVSPLDEESQMTYERIALLMPGQGSQFVGMGRSLAEAHEHVNGLYEEANNLLDVDLRRICWEGPEEELTRTENAQPAILLHSYAVWTSLPEDVRLRSVVAAGHSLGEFTAYLTSGALSFADALRLVRRRGELMGGAGDRRPGTMAAVIGLEPEEVTALCSGVPTGAVVPANYNAPGQIVISGDVAAVREACQRALAAGARRAIELNVSGAFHSPLMEDARDGLAAALGSVEIRSPAFPVVANASADRVTNGDTARDLLVSQLTSPVRWVECVEVMRKSDPDVWLEVGPGRVLGGLMKRIDREQVVRFIGDPGDIESFLEETGHA